MLVDEGNPMIDRIEQLIAVASGKGGVGKSTVASNLALVLAESGATVGLLDGDIYGPSVPTMFGVKDAKPEMGVTQQSFLPIEALGVKLMSMGFLMPQEEAAIVRGPMVHSYLKAMLDQCEWGELDYLVIDLPPGTGDAQLTLCQGTPLTGAVVVTTPQDVSLIDARKGLQMFRNLNVPILGLVENMSFFECPNCQHRTDVFRHGGGKNIAERLDVPFLGHVPLDPAVVLGGDEGLPVVRRDPESAVAKAFVAVARNVREQAAGLQSTQIPGMTF
jgi:ATP-binding protein involved in chromosome partitioning